MNEWISFNKPIPINVCVIIQRRRGKYDKWEYIEISRFMGDWNDLVDELHNVYGLFADEVEYLGRVAKHERLDHIAGKLEKEDMPYEFMLKDGTDNWYCAYCKPAVFRIDSDGGLR